jgi:uncharacterized protein (TIGR00299 family) protein
MIALVEPFAGASGNMLLGALLDANPPELWTRLIEALKGLSLEGWQGVRSEVQKQGIASTHMDFVVAAVGHAHRGLTEILELLDASSLSAGVKEASQRVFQRLGEAEARVHGKSLQDVHFHEVGAIDAILDIAGFCFLLEELSIQELYCQPLPQGRGAIECAHGVFPNPGPATVELLKGFPVRTLDVEQELVTPTGAALLTTLAHFEAPPIYRCLGVGYGAGTRDLAFSNVLRIQIGELVGSHEHSHPHRMREL